MDGNIGTEEVRPKEYSQGCQSVRGAIQDPLVDVDMSVLFSKGPFEAMDKCFVTGMMYLDMSKRISSVSISFRERCP